MADALRDWLIAEAPGEKSESPMESLLFAGWAFMIARNGVTPDSALTVIQQATVGPYRADFLFTIKDAATNEVKRLVVEVDGHDFHERTKRQAAHDKSRDRWMVDHHYSVMRFSGSEVWANPFKCADEIIDRLHLLRCGKSTREQLVAAGLAAIRNMLAEDS